MEYRADSHPIVGTLGRAFYPTAIASVVVVLLTVHLALGPSYAVFGLYALLGLVGGALVHYGFDDAADRTGFHVKPNWRIDERVHRLGVYAAVAAAVGVVAVTGEPLAVFLGLAVGYALVVRQLFADPVPERLVPQITALFLLSPLAKYLSSGMYVGHGDLLDHTRITGDLMTGGSLEAIAYASYQDFPGLHLVASAVGSLTGLGGYDGLMLTGLAVYAIVLPAVYLVVVRITEHPPLALWTTFAVAVLDDLSFYASYVFPQSLAIGLIAVLAVLATLVSRDAIKWRVTATFAVVAVVLSLTHHLTQVLVLPVLALGAVLYAVRGRTYFVETLRSRQLLLAGFAVAVTTVRLFQTGFLDRLVAKVAPLFGGGVRGGYTESGVFAFGQPARSETVGAALDWLFSPYGLYLVLLLLVFSVGVVAFMRAPDRPVAQTALFTLGVLGALIVFETPISIQSLVRIRSPWLFVFAFVLGVGLLQLKRFAGADRRGGILMAVVVVLAVSAPLVTADDYYDLDPRPSMQTSFSEAEEAELEALSGYVASSEHSIGSFWLTRLVMERHEASGIHNARVADGQVILPGGHFIYRSSWPGSKVHFTVGEGEQLYSNTLYVAGDWLDRRITATNKVYSVGGTGIVWQPTDRPF